MSQPALQILPYGTKVTMANGEIKGIVTAVSIRDTWMQYEISYFNKGEHQTLWLTRISFEIDTVEKKKPGLVNYEPNNNDVKLLE